MANEEILAFLFAGMLIAGTLIILLSPLIFKLTEEVTKWKLYALLALVLGVMGVSVYVVWLALTEPLFFLPFVALVVGLRGASPTLLYRSLRDRFELKNFWVVIKILLAAGFIGYAGYLVYSIIVDVFQAFTGPQSTAAVLSEQLIMAIGGSFAIIRVFSKILPESLKEKPTVWVSAILLSLALAVLAPYAFPNYDIYYRLAGLGGWLLGFVVIWRFP